MKNKLLFFFLLVCTGMLSAQVSNTSVYSRYGLGQLHQNVNVKQQGLGGLSMAYANRYSINFGNSATLSLLDQPSFIVGLSSEIVTASNNETDQTNSFTQFDHFALALPFAKKKMALSLGIIPFSKVDYEYTQDISDPDISEDPISAIYGGEGGLNSMFLNASYRLSMGEDTSKFAQFDDLSFGAGLNYYFGSVTHTRQARFQEVGFINSFIAERTTYNDVGFDLSAFYRKYLTKRIKDGDNSVAINFGLKYKPSLQLSGTKREDVFSYVLNSFGEEVPLDSVMSFRDQDGFALIPQGLGAGVGLDWVWYNKKDNFYRTLFMGLDYTQDNWSDFELNFADVNSFEEIVNTDKLTFGLEYLPNSGSINKQEIDSYFQACTYRLGLSTSTLNLSINDEAITENGINLGISLPLIHNLKLRSSDSHIDISASYGTRGTTDNNLIKEDYLRIMLGVSFHPTSLDRWFRKRKYD